MKRRTFLKLSWLTLILALGRTWMSASASTKARKKLIEFGWDEPDTRFLREHLHEMEQMPFDGVVFQVKYPTSKGDTAVFEWTCWSPEPIPLEAVKPAIEDLKAVPFQRFTDNFLRFNVTPGNVDWFNDREWESVLHNAEIAARILKEAKIKGLLFDVEQYNTPLFRFPSQPQHHSFEEYAQQVRLRGRQFIQQLNRGVPKLTLLLTFGYSLARHQGKPLSEAEYGLLEPFLDGMLEGASSQTLFVDGWEFSYPYKTAQQFEEAYRIIREQGPQDPSLKKKYQKQFRAGFGLWMDCRSHQIGWHTDRFTRNYFTPMALETALTAALERSDEYVWLYSERLRWWPRQNLPESYIDAVRNARNRAGLKEPP